MPKKSVAARSGAQRQKPRTQKSFELVRPGAEEQEDREQVRSVPAAKSVSTITATPQQQERTQAEPARIRSSSTAVVTQEAETKTKSEVVPTAKESVSTRTSTRRPAAPRTQIRNQAALITPEHFAYVRRDLMIIGILALLMFTAIIVLYFVFGRGA